LGDGDFLDLVELKRLFYFRQATNFKSLRQAARQLGITQPALTRHIQHLEEGLGVSLFQWCAGGNKLTEAGRIVAGRTDQLLGFVLETRNALDDMRRHPAGFVTVALPMSFAAEFLGIVFRAFKERFPKVHLRFIEGTTRHVEEWLVHGQAEVGVLVSPSRATGLIEEIIYTEELYLIGKALPGGSEPISLQDVSKLPLVLPLFPQGTRWILNKLAMLSKVPLVPILEIDNPNSIKNIVMENDIYTVHSSLTFRREIEEGRIAARRITPTPIRNLAIATVRGEPLSSAARAFAVELRKSIRPYNPHAGVNAATAAAAGRLDRT
jgi:LysR family nitrogen assimilation transcriptional regulator